MIAVVLGVLLSADDCGPLPGAANAEQARAYLSVAKEEAAAGAWASALDAYRHAAGRLPDDANDGLERACARVRLQQAEKLLEGGDPEGALQRLAPAADLPSELLRGSMLAQRGRLDEARELLEKAAGDQELAGPAALQLALLELRAGRPEQARRWIDAAKRDERTAALALQLEPLAQGSGRIYASASVEAGYDSNPLLVPSIESFGAASTDGFVGAGAEASAAPFGVSWPKLELRGAYRKYFSSSADDTGLGGASVRYEPRLGPAELRLAYDFDFISFGEAPWLLRNAGSVGAGGHYKQANFGASYQLRYESYLQPTAADDSGVRHAVRVFAGATLGPVDFELAWLFTTAPIPVVYRGYTDDGAELVVAVSLRPVAIVAETNVRRRLYGDLDPDFGVVRDDLLFEARLRVEVPIGRVFRVYVAGEARTASSNIDALSYSRFAGIGGVMAAAGFL
jgi:tetratricopeptide (TPR) repeat protein